MTDATDQGPVTMLATPIRLDFEFTPGIAQSKFLRGLERGEFLGQRCGACGKVYVPSRGTCPTDGVLTTEDVVLLACVLCCVATGWQSVRKQRHQRRLLRRVWRPVYP